MSAQTISVLDVLRKVRTNPGEVLIRQWNWKSAVFSSILRALIFLIANLTAGWRSAAGAMAAEFLFRAVISGFYGSLIQAFRNAEPAWIATLTMLILLPFISHSLELAMHLARGTPKLLSSVIASVAFTEIASLFNLYAMRRGALVVGAEAPSIGADLRRVPRLIAGFIAAGPLFIFRYLRGKQQY